MRGREGGGGTSQHLLDLRAGATGGELVDDVQGRLVVRVACADVDPRLETDGHRPRPPVHQHGPNHRGIKQHAGRGSRRDRDAA